MGRAISRLCPRGAPAAVAAVIWIDAIVARLALRADEAQVYVLGKPVEWVCWLRWRFGLPCPTCGLTRSLVLSLHGDLARAWILAPAGPVMVLGLLAFATAMLIEPARRRIRKPALVYSAAAAAVWGGGWMHSLVAAVLALRGFAQ